MLLSNNNYICASVGMLHFHSTVGSHRQLVQATDSYAVDSSAHQQHIICTSCVHSHKRAIWMIDKTPVRRSRVCSFDRSLVRSLAAVSNGSAFCCRQTSRTRTRIDIERERIATCPWSLNLNYTHFHCSQPLLLWCYASPLFFNGRHNALCSFCLNIFTPLPYCLLKWNIAHGVECARALIPRTNRNQSFCWKIQKRRNEYYRSICLSACSRHGVRQCTEEFFCSAISSICQCAVSSHASSRVHSINQQKIWWTEVGGNKKTHLVVPFESSWVDWFLLNLTFSAPLAPHRCSPQLNKFEFSEFYTNFTISFIHIYESTFRSWYIFMMFVVLDLKEIAWFCAKAWKTHGTSLTYIPIYTYTAHTHARRHQLSYACRKYALSNVLCHQNTRHITSNICITKIK